MVALRKLILPVKCSEFQVGLFDLLVFLINLVLNNSSEFGLHVSHLRRNDVSEGLSKMWYFKQLIVAGGIQFDKVLGIWNLDFVMGRNRLKEHCLGLVSRHITQLLGLLLFIFVVAFVFGRDLRNYRRDSIEKLCSSDSRASCITHILSEFLGLLEAVDAQDLPGTGLEVLLVVEHDTCELTLLECLENSVCLTLGVSLFEKVGDLQRYLGEDLWLHLLLSGHFVEKVLGLGKHEIAEHSETLSSKVWTDFSWFELRDILLQIVE